MTRLYTFMPYAAPGETIGQSIECHMQALKPDDWTVIMDHDVMFTVPNWYPTILEAIARHPQYALLTVSTNRCGELKHPWQMVPGVEVDNHDMRYHRALGAQQLAEHGSNVLDVTQEVRKMNGVAIVMRRKAWDAVKEMPGHVSLVHRPSILSFDLKLHARLRKKGHKVGLMKGIYCYHWYRADGATHIY